MQQTETYKLNLIEKTDTFSPDALNENTQKVENALTAHEGLVEEVTDGLAEQTADLDNRVTALEVHKIAVGTYNGSAKNLTVNVGFRPSALIICRPSIEYNTVLLVAGETLYGVENGQIIAMCSITSNGFTLTGSSHNYQNNPSTSYHYLALA